jgi:hypothetical protein
MQIIIKESQFKVILDYNKTCDNIDICQQNMGTKKSMKRKLLTERQVLRRICVPTKDRDGTWLNTINDELNDLIRNKNIFKLQYGPKIKLACHVHRMTNYRMDDNSMSGNRYLQDWQEDQN